MGCDIRIDIDANGEIDFDIWRVGNNVGSGFVNVNKPEHCAPAIAFCRAFEKLIDGGE